MKVFLLVFDTVSVDVSIWLLRSDNTSMLKGTIVLALCLFRNRAVEKSSIILRDSRASSPYDCNAAKMGRQVCP
jgi:hypothetical protein